MKVRIFSLAKELEIDSKELIQHCADAGLDVKNSPLASISEEERDRLLDFLKTLKSRPAAAAPTVAPEPMVPKRDDAAIDRMGKVRPIRQLGPLSGARAARRDAGESEQDDGVREAEAMVTEPEAAVPPAVDVEPGVPDAAAAEAVTEVGAEQVPEPGDAPVAAEDESGDVGEPTPEKARPAGISRSDYVAPGGHSARGMQSMESRGTIRDLGASKLRKEKPTRKTTALPNIAVPNFKPPVPAAKKGEAPAQKPEVRITAEGLKGTKLVDFIKKKKEEHERGEVEEETPARRGKTGLTLDDMRQRRKRRGRSAAEDEEDSTGPSRARARRHRRGAIDTSRKSSASVTFPLAIREFCEEIGRTSKKCWDACSVPDR
ncbi:MAG: translation initiation factor IF-2 N-terminal domain-containing protein [Planctomycetaceae bacterium]